jgi:phosphohistidine swiveling domain-containing protein
MERFVQPLGATPLDLAQAGGKGANLNRLIRADLPVPPAYLIDTAAYRLFVSTNGLTGEIERLGRPGADPAAIDEASRQLRALFAAAPLPDLLRAAIYELAKIAGNQALAVRSSATAEDLPQASFAGQQDTFLNVRGRQALVEAVRGCWSSLWTARALAYRQRQGIAPGDVSLAVVVQEMVPAERSGVLFTINPLTGAQDEMLVNATWGLGEALVAGRVNPDTLVLDKDSGAIKEQQLGDKRLMTAPAASGTEEVAVASEKQAQSALTAEQASALAALCRQVEALFGSPQDIEWAIVGDQIFLLQSRPVTIAGDKRTGKAPGDDAWPPLIEVAPQPFDRWGQMDVGERWPEPVTPFTWSTAEPMIAENMARSDSVKAIRLPFVDRIQWTRREYGRVYFNEGAMVHLFRQGFGMPASSVTSAMGGQAGELGDNDGWLWRKLLRRAPTLVKMSLNWEQELKKYPDLFPRIDEWVARFMTRDLSLDDDARLWAESHSVWYKRLMEAMDYHSVATSVSANNAGMVASFVKRTLDDEGLGYRLMAGLTGIIASEIVPALWQMAGELRRIGLAEVVLAREAALAELRQAPVAAGFRQLLEIFLQRHGHRCMTEAEWLFPRWVEDPSQVIGLIAGYLKAGDEYNPLAAEARQRREREAITAQVEQKLDPLRRAYFRWALGRAHNTIRLRDNGQHFLVKLLLPMRIIYAELGRRWAQRDWLDDADDFFFLVTPEIEGALFAGDPQAAGLNLKQAAAQRRLAYDYWRQARFPEALGADGRPLALATATEIARTLTGIPASAGQARGQAVIINSPAEAGRVQPGQILVTRSTDPGWTPLFSLVGGLVLEIGGQLSHGAIVAREYGLPAVVNVPEATARIQDGQTIVVDGSAGRVYLEDE